MSRVTCDPPADREPGTYRVGQLREEHATGLRAFVRLQSGGMPRALGTGIDLVLSVHRELLDGGGDP